MPVVWIRIPKIDKYSIGYILKDVNCPYCDGINLQRWGRARRGETTIERYRCSDCERTFRNPYPARPEGVLESTLQLVAGTAWVLGLSTRKIEELFSILGLEISRSSIWRTGKGLVQKMSCPEHTGRRHEIDPIYVAGVSEQIGVVVGVIFPHGSQVILGTLAETDPRQVKACLGDLLAEAAVRIEIGLNGQPLPRSAARQTCPVILV